ncbi:MAG: hypothetical protein J6B04_05645 [Clostridia bacterium]|nr:hypothetical protein [Clostridia bacterium]
MTEFIELHVLWIGVIETYLIRKEHIKAVTKDKDGIRVYFTIRKRFSNLRYITVTDDYEYLKSKLLNS